MSNTNNSTSTRLDAATKTRTAAIEQSRSEERNRTYIGYIRSYKSYIDSKRQLMDTNDFQSSFDLYNQEVGAFPYVSVKACEEFFIEVVYPRPISRYSAMKYVYAIAALAK